MSTAPDARDGLAVVVVDDDRGTVKTLVEQLRPEGTVLISARNAMLALAYVERHPADVVLLNLRMPGEDGWWFARQMRALADLDRVPIYAVGGRDQQPPDASSGFTGYFPEPVNLYELRETFSALRHRRR